MSLKTLSLVPGAVS